VQTTGRADQLRIGFIIQKVEGKQNKNIKYLVAKPPSIRARQRQNPMDGLGSKPVVRTTVSSKKPRQ